MITVNFYKDGVYVKGHDREDICSVISYAMYACMNDLQINDNKTRVYQSIHDEKWSNLGFTFICFDCSNDKLVEIFINFKSNLIYWIDEIYQGRVKLINKEKEYINYGKAFQDAKSEQGIV